MAIWLGSRCTRRHHRVLAPADCSALALTTPLRVWQPPRQNRRRLPKARKPLALLGPCFKTGHREPTQRQRPRHGSVRTPPESPEDGRSCPSKPPSLNGTREHPPTRLASPQKSLRTFRGRPAPSPDRTKRRPRLSHQRIATPADWQELYEQRPLERSPCHLLHQAEQASSPLADGFHRAPANATVPEDYLNTGCPNRLGALSFPPNGFTLY